MFPLRAVFSQRKLMFKLRLFSIPIVILLLVASCSSPASGGSSPATDSTAAKVAAVTPLTPSSLASSGANSTTLLSSGAVDSLLASLLGDPATPGQWHAIQTDLLDALSVSSTSTATALRNAQTSFYSKLNSFSTSKTASLTATIPAGSLGSSVNLNSGSLDFTINAASFDGSPINSSMSNLKTLSGSFLETFDAGLASGFPSGPIKDAKLRINFGTDASATADRLNVFVSNTGNLSVTANGKLSASLALSVNEGGSGGKIIVNADSQFTNTQTYALPATNSLTNIINAFLPSSSPVTVTVSVYKDDGTLTWSNTYASYSAFTTAFPSLAK